MDTMAERLAAACDMADFGIDLQNQRLRRLHPEASEEDVALLLHDWLLRHPGAEFGDAPGRVVVLAAQS